MENNNNLSLKSLSSQEINKIEEFRKSNHTGVLAILFSDIVNSTYATEKLGEQTYSKLRHIHDELFKRIMCRENAGIIIKEIGDSFLCVFAEPSTAVSRAVEFQRAIHSNKEHLTVQDYTLSVKIGIHVGQVAVENSLALDIFGRHVNRAARIESIAHGGQILTSQSIWENAVGWLKGNNELKVGWVSYGKTKLKGIDESVDIFGFYPTELGKPPAPKVIRRQKLRRAIYFAAIFVAAMMLSFFLFKKVNHRNDNAALPTARKSFYVQFDFSELGNQLKNKSQNSVPDTIALAENLLAQILTVINPDSLVTEPDLMKSFSRQGKLYIRHQFNEPQKEKYFNDTLKFMGALLIKAIANTKLENDSITFRYWISVNKDNHWMAEDSTFNCSLKDLKKEFRNWFQDELMKFWVSVEQGYVLESDNGIAIFKINKEANLREGATITYIRPYYKKEGLKLWISDHEKKIEYLKDKPQYTEELKKIKKDFENRKKEVTDDLINNKCGWNFRIGISGKVIDLHDSTGKTTWTYKGIFPFEKPRKGDIIKLDY